MLVRGVPPNTLCPAELDSEATWPACGSLRAQLSEARLCGALITAYANDRPRFCERTHSRP